MAGRPAIVELSPRPLSDAELVARMFRTLRRVRSLISSAHRFLGSNEAAIASCRRTDS